MCRSAMVHGYAAASDIINMQRPAVLAAAPVPLPRLPAVVWTRARSIAVRLYPLTCRAALHATILFLLLTFSDTLIEEFELAISSRPITAA